MNLAEIKNGIVTNVAVVDPLDIPEHMSDWIEIKEGGIGWEYDGSTFIDPNPQVEPTPEELLEQERSGMRSSSAQMRLALHRLGILTQVQAIADSDPEASIVWEYATTIERTSPLIDALGGPNGFTPEQIDDIFRTAMEISV